MKQKKAEKIIERRKKEIQQAEKDEKDKMAREEYERWLVIYICFTLYKNQSNECSNECEYFAC